MESSKTSPRTVRGYLAFQGQLVELPDERVAPAMLGAFERARQQLALLRQAAVSGYEALYQRFQATPLQDIALFKVGIAGGASIEALRVTNGLPWFDEVEQTPVGSAPVQTVVVRDDDLAQRLLFVRALGYLPVGKGETLLLETSGRSPETVFHAFGLTDAMEPWIIVDDWTARKLQSKRRIADLRRRELRWTLRDYPPSRLTTGETPRLTEIDRHTYALLVDHQAVALPSLTKYGSTIMDIDNAGTGTGCVARYRKPTSLHYETSQDAWYFGVWVDPVEREILTYAEGDATLIRSATDEQFRAELGALAAFYGRERTPSMMAFGGGEVTGMFGDLFLRLRDPDEHIQVTLLDRTAAVRTDDGAWQAPLFVRVEREHAHALTDGQAQELPTPSYEVDLLNPLAFDPSLRVMARREGLHLHLTVQVGEKQLTGSREISVPVRETTLEGV